MSVLTVVLQLDSFHDLDCPELRMYNKGFSKVWGVQVNGMNLETANLIRQYFKTNIIQDISETSGVSSLVVFPMKRFVYGHRPPYHFATEVLHLLQGWKIISSTPLTNDSCEGTSAIIWTLDEKN